MVAQVVVAVVEQPLPEVVEQPLPEVVVLLVHPYRLRHCHCHLESLLF